MHYWRIESRRRRDFCFEVHSRLRAGRKAIIFFIVAGGSRRHLRRWYSPTALLELFAQLLLLHSHGHGYLLKLFYLVHEFGDASVHHVCVMARVLIFAIELNRA